MNLKVIDEKTYKEYALKSPYISIYQLPEWGKLKSITGWDSHLVGLYDGNNLKAATLLLSKTTPIKKKLFYAPRGYLLDYNEQNLLDIFHNNIIKYVKDNKGFMLKIDPNVIYATRNSEGLGRIVVADDILEKFLSMGYKHLGFTQNFETLQPRNLCRFELKDTYEETLNSFSKTTRKNIDKYTHMGVEIRTIDTDEIDLFVSLLQETANKKHFVIRPVSYYKKMYELMKEYIKLYIVYIDPVKYYEYVIRSLDELKKELENLEKQMAKLNIGEKLRRQKEILKNKIVKKEEELAKAKEIKDGGIPINIGALMSVFLNDEGITFMSGTSSLYKEFGPKYVFYNEHIKECLKQKKKYCNFYGISGDIKPQNPYYSIYEIKKGFNPEIVELLGEFDYIINPIYYHIYKIALKIYKLLK